MQRLALPNLLQACSVVRTFGKTRRVSDGIAELRQIDLGDECVGHTARTCGPFSALRQVGETANSRGAQRHLGDLTRFQPDFLDEIRQRLSDKLCRQESGCRGGDFLCVLEHRASVTGMSRRYSKSDLPSAAVADHRPGEERAVDKHRALARNLRNWQPRKLAPTCSIDGRSVSAHLAKLSS